VTIVDGETIGQRHAFAGRAFERPGEDAGVHGGRGLFFAAVHQVEPRVVRDLMGEPLALYRPLFEAALAHLPEDRRTWGRWRYAEAHPGWDTFRYAVPTSSPEVRQLRDLLLRWSRKWRLGDAWCLAAAVDTLADLSAAGDAAEPGPLSYPWATMIEIPFSDAEMRFTFSDRGWSPTLVRWERFEGWLDDAYERAKRDYKERIEALCRDEGLVAVTPRRQRKGDHFDWLARSQVGRDTYSEIARAVGTTRQGVSKAVKAAAASIGLTPADDGGPNAT